MSEPTPEIKEMLTILDERTKNLPLGREYERSLFILLNQFAHKLPEMDGYFHKSFRQIDVTGSSAADMAIWNLLHCCDVFWDVFEEVRVLANCEQINIRYSSEYLYKGWRFEYKRTGYSWPWPLKKDGEFRKKAGDKFWRIFEEFISLSIEEQEKYRV